MQLMASQQSSKASALHSCTGSLLRCLARTPAAVTALAVLPASATPSATGSLPGEFVVAAAGADRALRLVRHGPFGMLLRLQLLALLLAALPAPVDAPGTARLVVRPLPQQHRMQLGCCKMAEGGSSSTG
jgi:hypothetical protein